MSNLRRLKVSILIVLVVALIVTTPAVIGAGGDPFAVRTVQGDGSFIQPVAVRHAGDGSNRLFVVEKAGKIISLTPAGNQFRRTVFLDITDRVNSGGSEEGLLGLAFHPDFRRNGMLYVNYTSYKNQTVIASYKTTSSANLSVNKNSEVVLLTFAQPYSNHNGGDLAFGPDKFLYIASGDGGSGGDPFGYGQSLRTLLGKILRIDVRAGIVNGRKRNYMVPSSNPFVKRTGGVRPEIYAYGLRNPWRISFDRQTGELWAADVGQNQLEEVNIIKPGGNYGWNVMEGTQCYGQSRSSTSPGCNPSRFIAPVFEYNHRLGKSVTGGYVYRGTSIPALRGKYVMADFISGRVWTLEKRANGRYASSLLNTNIPLVSSFGEDEQGELYLVNYRGALLRLVRR